MPIIEPFEKYYKEYDDWFIKNKNIYFAELNAIKSFIPKNKRGLEIGVGSGRFALPLAIKVGIEPSKKLINISRKRGLQVIKAVAEKLPIKDEKFDFILMVTTICFLDNVFKSFQETYRILKKDGILIVGFIDKNSDLGLKYQSKKIKSRFYNSATFYSVDDVVRLLRKAFFDDIKIKKLFVSNDLNKKNKSGNEYNKESFVLIRTEKTNTFEGDET